MGALNRMNFNLFWGAVTSFKSREWSRALKKEHYSNSFHSTDWVVTFAQLDKTMKPEHAAAFSKFPQGG